MTAFNVVRFRVKPGRDEEFLEFHRNADADFAGYRGGVIVKTGDRAYCFIGGWDDFDSIVAARPQMIGMLDQVREMLEDQGGGLGLTDPVSGETVVELPAKQGSAARKRATPRKRSAKRSEGASESGSQPARGAKRSRSADTAQRDTATSDDASGEPDEDA